MSANEVQKRKILRFLGDEFTESPDDLFYDNVIAENCNMDETETKQLCTFLEKEGLIEHGKRGTQDNSYKIAINGLILLESYLVPKTHESGIDLSKIKKIVKQGLDKMQITNLELQVGVVDAGKKHNLKDGLYYVVLIDLVGSTLASSKMNGAAFTEWIKKFLQIAKNALNTRKRNLAIYVKSIGDGALFLFRNFDDILAWKNKVDELCKYHNDICKKEGKLDFYQYTHKTIIHSAEVYFDLENFDANAFGVNLVFKLEKKFGKGEIGITDTVKQIILQEINAGKFKINNADSYSLAEGETVIPLWKLVPIG